MIYTQFTKWLTFKQNQIKIHNITHNVDLTRQYSRYNISNITSYMIDGMDLPLVQPGP